MKPRLIRAAAVLIAIAWTASLDIVRAQDEGWTSIGPAGGTVYALAIDPDNHSIVYAGTNSGVFKSTDGGGHWSPANTGLPMPTSGITQNGGPYINSLAIDPQNTATVYAGVSFFGDDVFAEPSGRGVYRSDDGGDSWHAANTGIENFIVYALAIDPATPTTLFAGVKFGPIGAAHVFRSNDGGASWSLVLPQTVSGFEFANAIAVDPQTPGTAYAGTSSGVFKTTDGGTTWAPIASGPSGGIVTALVIHPSVSTVVYAATRGGGVFTSIDAGSSWTPINAGLTSLLVRALAIDVQSDTLYAGLETGEVFKTTSEGAAWTPVSTGLEASRINSLAVDPETPGTVYAATERRGVFKTVDAGNQWTQTSLSSLRVFAVAIDPNAAKTFVGEDRGRVYMRSDQGEWTYVDLDPDILPRETLLPRLYVTALAIDPLVPSTVYAATTLSLYKSTDGGATWIRVLRFSTYTVALDPVDPSIVYAAGNGAHKSVDGGASWIQISQDLTGRVHSLVVDPQPPHTTLYAGIAGSFGRHGVFKSVDAGATWNLAIEGLSVGALAIDPQTTSTIYAGTATGVFKSTDAGASWFQSSSGLPAREVLALVVDPDAPSIVFAGTYGGGVFKSVDGAASWSPMNDQLENLFIRALALDLGSGTLYAGTDGGVFAIATARVFPLTVRTAGHGISTIVSFPQGIDCGSVCTDEFAAGARVTLTATTQKGIVKGWTGCDSDTGRGKTSTCTVTIEGAREVAVYVVGPPIVSPGHDVSRHNGKRPRHVAVKHTQTELKTR